MWDTVSLFQKNTGLAQILDDSLARFPDRTAVVSGERRLTYRELDEQIRRFALVLERDGVGPGVPVAIISRNCVEFLVAEFAVLRLGAVSVKINWRLSPDEIQYLFELNQVRYAVARYERLDWGRQVYQRNRDLVKFYILNPDERGRSPFYELIDAAPPASQFADRPVDPDSPAIRVHTSGTTGAPKCVVHTHARMLAQLRSCLSVLAFEPGVVFQVASQLFHIACVGPYMVLAAGGTVVLMSRFEPREFLDSMVREQVTRVSLIPVVLKRLLALPELDQCDLSHLKFINYSTCPMPQALLQEASHRFQCDFYQSYGMTEMASIVTVLSPADHFCSGGKHLSSVGRPIPGVQVRIEGPDGAVLPPRQEGEVVIQGPGQMQGYFRASPALSARALQGGWYHTGDMGYLDEEGFLYVVGRRDDLIISGGENIYPMEIVDVIMRLTDDVQEAAVYGVPDPEWGERVKASVVLRPGSWLTPQALLEYCRANIPHYKAPKEIEFLSALPKSSTGKVLVQDLKAVSREN